MRAKPRSEGERTVRQFELSNLALVVLAVVLTHVIAGAGTFLWGVIVGGLLGALNLRAMVFIGRRILTSKHKSRALWATLFGFKLVILCTVVWLCLSYLPLHSLGFLVGFSTVLPATLVLTAIRALERPNPASPFGGEGPNPASPFGGERPNPASPFAGERSPRSRSSSSPGEPRL